MKKSFITHQILPLILLIMSLSILIVCDDGGKKDDKNALTLMAIDKYEDYLAQKALDDQVNDIGGSVSGLHGTLVLRNNGGDDLTISGDGPFKFPSTLKRGGTYDVSIKEQPAGPLCELFNGKGTALSEVNDIIVVCSYKNYPVGVTVKGLTGKLNLLNNSIEPLAIDSDGSYLFNQPIVKGGRYRVTMTSKPNEQSCTVNNAEGPVDGPVNLEVNCSTLTYKIGGTVKGLKEGSIILQNNAGDDISIDANGSFTFKEPVVKDSDYNVTIRSQAGIKPCRVINGAGKATKDVTDATVLCSYRVVLYSAGLYNGDMGGPDGADSKCAARGSVSGLEAPYTAFICKSGSLSIRNMPAVYGFSELLPITTPGGAIIADNWEKLINGNFKASPATLVDPSGRNTPFWTGSDTTGQYKGERNCGNYSWFMSISMHGFIPAWSTTSYSSSSANGWTGSMTLTGTGWLSQREIACTQNSWLLCAAYGPEPASGLTAYIHIGSVRPAVLWGIIIGGVIVSIGAIMAINIVRSKKKQAPKR
ncbi:MAG: hypothetical protein KA369_16980 [Spirochaetes bacterium]|nr:hypothetical protein [Spirochaetota bacterium]